ncbi:MAG: hypoxanthine phosphoribosyltransferase [Bacteroidetes bacterium HGW-Bacteroidetes-21]|jgi:hypoxanthine phosphoribosyltransferase|nr:MAG: hypoxanthine phosphoribosyltransferase [Bacteroidetes bacterium HGW-Bacteroidetes-21]
MNTVKILDKVFEPFITNETIDNAVEAIAQKMNQDLAGKDVVFVAILNGAFMFASDLFKKIDFSARITFVKMASYVGTSTSGSVKQLVGINEELKDKVVVIIEDIVDTGITIDLIIRQLKTYDPSEVRVASLLVKPEAMQKDVIVDYTGIEIPNRFIVGYGLDYNGYGRNLKEIFVLSETHN